MKKYSKEDLAFIKNRKAKQKTSDSRMIGKTCVITGATSGVGLEAVKKLAAGGASLILVARNPEKAEKIKNEIYDRYGTKPEIIISDFSVFASVRRAADQIAGLHPKIDILINSAGLHSTSRKITSDGFELVFQVNHLSSFLFTQLLLPMIKKSRQGRIIQVNSEGHRFGGLRIDDLDWTKRRYIGLRAYGASKTAQIMTVREQVKYLKDSNVTINAMHPGGVKTNIGNNNGWLYRTWLKYIITPFLKDPQISGEALYYLASSPELDKISGRYFNLTIDEKPMPHALDTKISEQIWDISLSLTGSKDQDFLLT